MVGLGFNARRAMQEGSLLSDDCLELCITSGAR